MESMTFRIKHCGYSMTSRTNYVFDISTHLHVYMVCEPTFALAFACGYPYAYCLLRYAWIYHERKICMVVYISISVHNSIRILHVRISQCRTEKRQVSKNSFYTFFCYLIHQVFFLLQKTNIVLCKSISLSFFLFYYCPLKVEIKKF